MACLACKCSPQRLRLPGYNRYQQACPGNTQLRLGAPAALSMHPFALERILGLAAGGGCSVALTEARESLVACCLATLKACLDAGDATRCVELLVLAGAFHSPPLTALAEAAETCVRRHRQAVAREAERQGIQVEPALAALLEMRSQMQAEAAARHVVGADASGDAISDASGGGG